MLQYGWQDSSAKYYAYQRPDQMNLRTAPESLQILKNESFAVQLLLWSDEDTHYALDHDRISWRGIHLNTYRVAVTPWFRRDGKKSSAGSPSLNFVDYVMDDEGRLTSDPLVPDRGIERNAGCFQGLWISGCFEDTLNEGDYVSEITIFAQNGYEDEIIVEKFSLEARLLSEKITQPINDEFFLDLWQHPSNWARTYKVPMWSEEHFEIIRTHLLEMARLGQKVVTIICSDYPWAGQRCYQIMKNSSNLFEHNMVQVQKNSDGTFKYDFDVIKKYIEIARSVGIQAEIDLFGLLGNWDAYSFGNPVEAYRDPIRIKYRNEKDGTYSYMATVEEIKDYIKSLFEELYKMGVWEKIRVICDEPDHPKSFEENVGFLQELAPAKLEIKSAIHVPDIMPLSTKVMTDVSLGINVLGEQKGDVSQIHEALRDKNGTLTWYVCCFPNRPNNFISSPRLENRLIGWLTHYFNLDGFLRWDFAIWPDKPYEDASFKYPKWTAGDMFFVYPGANMKPVRSQRLENLLFGIQDFQLLRLCGKRTEHNSQLEQLLGEKSNLVVHNLDIDMEYSLDYERYMDYRNDMLRYISGSN